MKLLAINVGTPREVKYEGRVVSTGIYKSPVPPGKKVRVDWVNLEGDGQADLTVHGGRDKALYAYSADVFTRWEREIGRPLEKAELGENLTFDELDENQVFVGSVYQLGTAELQVTQPRFPCYKLQIRMGDKAALKQFIVIGRPGIYFRVLKPGEIAVGDNLTLKQEDPRKVPLQALWNLKVNPRVVSIDMIERITEIPDLVPYWLEKAERMLEAARESF